MNHRNSWTVGTVLLLLTSAVAGCKSGGSDQSSTQGPTTLAADEGICQPTCEKTCTTDNDCETSDGELCCDYGAAGKACALAPACPRVCDSDQDCDTTNGEVCLRPDLNVSTKYCSLPTGGVVTCDSDNDCDDGRVCCGNYDEAICLPPSNCPRACSESSTCDTASGEICCTSVADLEPNLAVDGLCLDPTFSPCPTACDSSTECDTVAGEVCCNGFCSAGGCPEICKESTDCTAQICCKSALVRLPGNTTIFQGTPSCAGTPFYTCADCSLGLCTCSSVPGCQADTTEGGVCEGFEYFCSDFVDATGCAMQAGCSWDGVFCVGSATLCSNLLNSADCGAQTGCSWFVTASSTCTGTPAPCSDLSYAECSSGIVPGCSPEF